MRRLAACEAPPRLTTMSGSQSLKAPHRTRLTTGKGAEPGCHGDFRWCMTCIASSEKMASAAAAEDDTNDSDDNDNDGDNQVIT